MFAEVVFPLPFRNSFTYKAPAEIQSLVKIGVRVVVPFGKRTLTGFVISTSESTEVKSKLKNIQDVLDVIPIFSSESLKFYRWISEYYMSSLGEALKNSVPYGSDVESKKTVFADVKICAELYNSEKRKNSPKAKLLKLLSEKESHKISQLQKELRKKSIYSTLKSIEKAGGINIVNQIKDPKVKVKTQLFVKLDKSLDEIHNFIPIIEQKAPKQVVILLELMAQKNDVKLSDLLEKSKTNASSVHSLQKKGFVKIFEKEIVREYAETYSENIKKFELTSTQKNVIEQVSSSIIKKEFKTFLLHGVTGSGKTQVYIELTKLTLAEGKNIVILVPEISLTPQITSRFFNEFGDKVAVMHSRMGIGERYDTWRKLVAGKFNIVIGPRSALFAPLENIGLIVVDEEHDQSYKQYDLAPKYQARDSAIVKGMMNNCAVVLGSATPSIESIFNSDNGKYTLLSLPERVDNATLPEIKLINVSLEKKQKRMESVFSHEMLKLISNKIELGEGVIVLQNRRGFATQVYCEDCGSIETCEDCSVPSVYHLKNDTLQCHYCGTIRKAPKACTTCGSLKVKFFGTGTQRVEDELASHLPEIKMERIDSDSISKKGKLGVILNQFRKGEIDVLVGTQMVSKGLDFSNVTLVCVVSAEATLWLPDFRADERTFQLLTQVSGRAGRSVKKGEVLIQTRDPKNFVLQKVLMNDFPGFYSNELELRKQGKYPPFYKLALIEFKNENEYNAKKAAKDFYRFIVNQNHRLVVSPVHEAVIARVKTQFRFQIVLKAEKSYDPSGKVLRTVIENAITEFNKLSAYHNVNLSVDIDPQSIL